MFRLFPLLAALVAVIMAGTQPLLAKGTPTHSSHGISNSGYVYLSRGLLPGHNYRIDVSSPTHTKFGGEGFESFTLIYKARASVSTTPLRFAGITPKSFTLTQPKTGRLLNWIVALTISDTTLRPLQVLVRDLGAHK